MGEYRDGEAAFTKKGISIKLDVPDYVRTKIVHNCGEFPNGTGVWALVGNDLTFTMHVDKWEEVNGHSG